MRELARRISGDASAAGLLIGNLVAVAIALFHPPITMSLMFLYWAECAVIGVFNVIKLCYFAPPLDEGVELKSLSFGARVFVKSFTPGLFLVHYGGFVFICFTMLLALADHEMRKRGVQNFDSAAYYGGFLLPVALLAAGHAVSFFLNFLGKREYERRTAQDQMFRPYGRVLLMMVVIFGGISLVIITGLPTVAALLFVPVKLLADLRAHFRDHDTGKPATSDPRM